MSLSIVILAAGQGKRMASDLPKVLHKVGGTSLLQHVINTAQQLKPTKIQVVYGKGGELVQQELRSAKVAWVQQKEQLGTGHALQQALPLCDDNDLVMVLYGDVPLITKDTLEKLLEKADKNHIAYLVAKVAEPSGLGRIVRDNNNHIAQIVEQKDASEEQQKICEINTGVLVAPARHLKKWLPLLKNNNQQKEYYLTDIVAMANQEKIPVIAVETTDQDEFRGVNDPWELSIAERLWQKRRAKEFMQAGVLIADPSRIDFRGDDIKLAPGVFLDINVILNGTVHIGKHSRIEANVILTDAVIGESTTIKANSLIEGAQIANHCEIGPFARIRPETKLADHVKIGNFVEVKKTKFAAHSKANHLSYLGDATIGEKVNIGAGTITCNYDGVNKSQTIIHDGVFVGSNTSLVAPIEIGKNATLGAGSTFSKNVPAEKLTVARAKQVTIENWQRPRKKDK